MCKFLLTIPVTLLAVAADLMHWLGDFISAAMITPRSLSSCIDSSSFLIDLVPQEFPMCMSLYLSALNLGYQVFDHRYRRSRSSCRVMLSVSVFILHQTLVSSANIFMSLIIQDGNSFTNSRKSNGSNTLPCGNPLNTARICKKVSPQHNPHCSWCKGTLQPL